MEKMSKSDKSKANTRKTTKTLRDLIAPMANSKRSNIRGKKRIRTDKPKNIDDTLPKHAEKKLKRSDIELETVSNGIESPSSSINDDDDTCFDLNANDDNQSNDSNDDESKTYFSDDNDDESSNDCDDIKKKNEKNIKKAYSIINTYDNHKPKSYDNTSSNVTQSFIGRTNRWNAKLSHLPEELGNIDDDNASTYGNDVTLNDNITKVASKVSRSLPKIDDSSEIASLEDKTSGSMTRILNPNKETQFIDKVKAANELQEINMAVGSLMEVKSSHFCDTNDDDPESKYHDVALNMHKYLKSEPVNYIVDSMQSILNDLIETDAFIKKDEDRKSPHSTKKLNALRNNNLSDGKHGLNSSDVFEELKQHGIVIPDEPRARIRNFLREPIEGRERPCCMKKGSCVSSRLMQYLKNQHFQTVSSSNNPSDRSTNAPNDHSNHSMSKSKPVSIHTLESWTPFVLREYITPATSEMIENAVLLGEDPMEILKHTPQGMCILCNRAMVSQLAARIACGITKTPVTPIQNHGNLFGIPGEYHDRVSLRLGGFFMLKNMVKFSYDDYSPVYYHVVSDSQSSVDGIVLPKKKIILKGWMEMDHMIYREDNNNDKGW